MVMYVYIYTDGSKNDRNATFAVCSEYGYKFDRIRNDSSVFPAYLYTIYNRSDLTVFGLSCKT